MAKSQFHELANYCCRTEKMVQTELAALCTGGAAESRGYLACQEMESGKWLLCDCYNEPPELWGVSEIFKKHKVS